MSPHPRPSTARIVLIACISLLPPACGGPPEGRVAVFPASGKVTYQGKPLPGATVLFRRPDPDPKIPSPMGTTGEDGSFTLHTYEPDDGGPAGDYLVAISTYPRTSRDNGSIQIGEKAKAKPPVDVLKGQFADPKTSGLKAAIKPGANELGPFDLK